MLRLKRILAGVTLIPAIALPGCTSPTSTTNNNNNGGPVAVTAVHITSAVTTVDVSATAQFAAAVEPANASQSVDWSTSDLAVATISTSGVLTAVSPGSVVVTAKSAADQNKQDQVTVNVACPSPRLVSSDVLEGDTTWENWLASPFCYDYHVTTTVSMYNGVLTIEPGTSVAFDRDVRLIIPDHSGLNAVGEPANRIVLTGWEAIRGYWDGVLLQGTQNPANRIENTVIEYGGASSPFEPADLTLETDTRTTLVDVTLRESAGYGLFMRYGAQIAGGGIVGGAFTKNTSGPAYVFVSTAHFFSESATKPELTGNDANHDFLHVEPEEFGVLEPFDWGDIGVPYRIVQITNTGAFDILDGGALTLQPGVRLEFEENMALAVNGGTLSAIGTAAQPIVFTAAPQPGSGGSDNGSPGLRGFWRGIQLENTQGMFDHVIIEYGGAVGGSGALKRANLRLASGAAKLTQVTLKNSILRQSAGYGFYAPYAGVEIVDFSANTLTENAMGPLFMAATHIGALQSNGSYTGNDIDRIFVQAYVAPVTGPATWRELGLPYYVLAEGGGLTMIVEEGASLTIEPGVEVLFAPGIGVWFQRANLTAIGTPQKRIRFAAEGAGAWKGFNFLDGEARFDYADIEGGGSEKWSTVTEAANISVTTAGGSSTVYTSPNVTSTGAAFSMAFDYGNTFGVPCLAPIWVPPPETIPQHCLPPSPALTVTSRR